MPELMVHKYAEEYIKADYSNYETILKIVQDNNIDLILTCANDFGCITSAYSYEEMVNGAKDYMNRIELVIEQKTVVK